MDRRASDIARRREAFYNTCFMNALLVRHSDYELFTLAFD